MDMQKTRHELNMAKWQELVLECRRSGMPARDWCRERGIKPGTYYRWQRLIWEKGVNQESLPKTTLPEFVECRPMIESASGAAAIVLHLSCGKVEIQRGMDRDTIENTLSVLQKLC